MSELTVRRLVRVVNPQGMHARPADLFARLANQFGAQVRLRKGNETVDGKSILSIMTLAAEEGAELEISASGHDAEHALTALCGLVEQGFEVDDVGRLVVRSHDAEPRT